MYVVYLYINNVLLQGSVLRKSSVCTANAILKIFVVVVTQMFVFLLLFYHINPESDWFCNKKRICPYINGGNKTTGKLCNTFKEKKKNSVNEMSYRKK